MAIDNERVPSEREFRDAGFVDRERARKNWVMLDQALGGRLEPLTPALLISLGRAADPDQALNNLEGFVSVLTDASRFAALARDRREIFSTLVAVLGASRFLSTFILSEGDAVLDRIADSSYLSRPAGKSLLSERLGGMLAGAREDKDVLQVLRRFRKHEMLRIGLRDLLGIADLQETVGELSDLAEVCLQAAWERVDRDLQTRFGRPLTAPENGPAEPVGFAVIAMGKLGGRELNFSSDIDLMYVYGVDGETEGVMGPAGDVTHRITNHEYFSKLAEKLTAAISEKTEDGFVFRVDLRLRPEGQRGPLVQSLGGYEIYYESWGQAWERAALIKARFVAGDPAVGREFVERITPFVYRKYLDFSSLDEIKSMKKKINKEVEQKGRTTRDVKLGYGGIREVEFLVQALQLVYGGRDRGIRERGTLKALHLLSQRGLISYQEQADLADAYTFLRTVEHRIQIVDDLQTQTIPSDPRELRALARRLGYATPGGETDLFLADYADRTRKVRGMYDNLFAFAPKEESAEAQRAEYALLFDPETAEREAVAALANFGFRDAAKAYRNLMLLREGPAFVHQTPRSRRLFSEIFPRLFERIVASPDPDMALHHLESYLSAQGSWDSFQARVRQDALAEQTLIAVFANSEYFSRMLVTNPGLLDDIVDTSRVSGLGSKSSRLRELAVLIDRAPSLSDKLDALRTFKQREEIRIGMADLLSLVPQPIVSRYLSRLAEVILCAAFDLAVSETCSRYGVKKCFPRLAVIGAGKLGGRELTYGSDLDILFVYIEDDRGPALGGITAFELYSKIAEKTLSYVSTMTRLGFAYRVDTRLRPTGSKGPLVQSVAAFRNYYSSQAETWERQALVNARFVAGDPEVGRELMTLLSGLIYRETDARLLAQDISSMRKRMEGELGNESAGQYNIKQGAGGLVDIEFLCQYLQLAYGHSRPWLRVPGARTALRAISKLGLVSEEDYKVLMEAYLFLRLLESRLRIVTNQATSALSRDVEKLHALGRRMGIEDNGVSAGEKLLKEYERVSASVRSIFSRLLDPDRK
jgi:glutamate-ammonia-ligase adenylyltransferase